MKNLFGTQNMMMPDMQLQGMQQFPQMMQQPMMQQPQMDPFGQQQGGLRAVLGWR